MEERTIDTAATADLSLARKARYDLDNLGEGNEQLQNLINRHQAAKQLLRELAAYHAGTFDHSIDVARGVSAFAMHRASQDNLSREDIEAATLAGLLHDIGKKELGEFGKRILSSSHRLSDTEREEMAKHAREGFLLVKAAADSSNDPLLSEAANIMVAHHEFQPGPYPRDSMKIGERRQPNLKRELLQKYVAAFDQAVGLAQGGEGGHAYMGDRLTAPRVRQRLVVDRDGNPTTYFNDIARGVVSTLIVIGVTRRFPNRVIHG